MLSVPVGSARWRELACVLPVFAVGTSQQRPTRFMRRRVVKRDHSQTDRRARYSRTAPPNRRSIANRRSSVPESTAARARSSSG